jgi:AcrR family transcriptional regulator
MAYRRTENVARRLAARHAAIVAAACAAAADGGMAAVQIAPVAARAGVAAGTVYRYFPSKTELVAALVAALSARESAAIERAAKAAPGPLSALAAAIVTFAARALAARQLCFALTVDGGHLPEQDAALAAAALIGALSAGIVGMPAVEHDPAKARARVQMLTLFALRGLGVVDARARGLVVQTALPEPD